MLKKLLPSCLFYLFLTPIHAETCPSLADLQANHLQNWRAFSIDNGTPLSLEQLDIFEKNAQRFLLAEWMPEAPEGEGHCYYETDSNYSEAFLAKHVMGADQTNYLWHDAGGGVLQCDSEREQCQFVSASGS